MYGHISVSVCIMLKVSKLVEKEGYAAFKQKQGNHGPLPHVVCVRIYVTGVIDKIQTQKPV